MLKNKKITFIGSGAIAEALVGGIIKAGLLLPSQITVCDISPERRIHMETKFGVASSGDASAAAPLADILFLTVKPQVIHTVLDSLTGVVPVTTTVISVVAGTVIDTLQQKLPQVPIVRVMPNTPVAVGEGMAAITLGKYADEQAGEMATMLFAAVGRTVMVAESAMDAVTGLSGSGPGYAYVMIDALADAGVRVGLPRTVAVTLAAQTLLGAARMVLETGEHPAKLRDMVTSPGGTTIAGIHVLEQNGVRAALIDAVVCATERSREMGRH